MLYRNKKIIKDTKDYIEVEGGRKYYNPSESERKYFISEDKIDLTEQKNKIYKAVFDDVLEIYRKHGLKLADLDVFFSFQMMLIEEMNQRNLAIKVVGIRDEDYAPGFNYNKAVTVDTLAKWNEEITNRTGKGYKKGDATPEGN